MQNSGEGKIDKALQFASDMLVNLSFISLLLMTTFIVLGVTTRYVFNDPLDWTDEFASYTMVWMVFFGITHTFLYNAHIKVDFFLGLMSPRVRIAFELFAHIVGLFFAILFLLACYSRFLNFWTRNTYSMSDIGVPLYLPSLPMVIGSALLLLVFAVKTMQLLLHMFQRD